MDFAVFLRGVNINGTRMKMDELKAIIKESDAHKVPENHHHYMFLTNERDLGQKLMDVYVRCKQAPEEQLLVEEHGIYWIVSKGNTLGSEFGDLALGSKGYKSVLTSRTMNTVKKVYKELSSR